MQNTFQLAEQALLLPSSLSAQSLVQVLDIALASRIDCADLFLQQHYHESWFLENGLVKAADFSHDQGFGLRAIAGETVGFAYASAVNLPLLQEAASAARTIACGARTHHAQLKPGVNGQQLYAQNNPIQTVADTQKVAFLQALDRYLRQADPRVCEVSLQLSASYDVVMIINSEGQLQADLRPLVNLHVSLIVEQAGVREKGSAGAGWRTDYRYFIDHERSYEIADRALAQALVNLSARPMPAGEMPVVLGPGWPAVLLHEAVGHGLEGDFNRKGSSVYSGRIGDQIASSLCTIVDDGTIAGRRGSLNIDDEGATTQCTTLIEKGILKNYMQDRLNAKLMGLAVTGNGRRESYACVPLPRMTNTYMLAGEHAPEEIIASVDKGLYAVDFAGGQVDITAGTFVFSTSEAYYIENGKIQYPVKGCTLIGNGSEVLMKIDMLGNDLKLDHGIGYCGKAGQTVPVGVGQPTLRISSMTVGGAQTAVD